MQTRSSGTAGPVWSRICTSGRISAPGSPASPRWASALTHGSITIGVADVVELARTFPATPIVMGHVGGVLGYGPYAGKASAILRQWKRAMSELATCPNVVVKLGGMVNRGAGFDFHNAPAPPSSEAIAELWRPYIETCIELFGATRCMFESNFPVDKMAIGYAALWNAFKRITAGASHDEKLALFAGTAARIYRLADVG